MGVERGPLWRGAGMLASIGLLAGAAFGQVLVVDQHVTPEGEIGGPVAVRIENGRIASVEPFEDGDGGERLSGVLAPGVIDLFSGVGVAGSNIENVVGVADQLTALDAIDPLHPSFHEALAAGVTSVLIGPAPTNPVSGAAVTVSTRVNGGGLDVLRDDGPMVLSLGTPAVDTAYGPTSRAGILFMVRQALDQAADDAPLGRVRAGEIGCVAFCPEGDDVAAGVLALAEFGLEPTIVHSRDAIDLSEDLKGYGGTIVFGPYTPATPPEVLAGAGFMERAGLRVAAHGNTGSRTYADIRMTAALGVRYGLSEAAARRSFTSAAAEVAGVSDMVGSLERGKRADLVLWSHDPLRPDAEPMMVWVQGELTHRSSSRAGVHGAEMKEGGTE